MHEAWRKDAEKWGKRYGMRLERKEGRRPHAWKTAIQRMCHLTTCKVPDVSLIVLRNQVPKTLTSAGADQAHLHCSSLGNIPRNLET